MALTDAPTPEDADGLEQGDFCDQVFEGWVIRVEQNKPRWIVTIGGNQPEPGGILYAQLRDTPWRVRMLMKFALGAQWTKCEGC